jgi:hypothetical protein
MMGLGCIWITIGGYFYASPHAYTRDDRQKLEKLQEELAELKKPTVKEVVTDPDRIRVFLHSINPGQTRMPTKITHYVDNSRRIKEVEQEIKHVEEQINHVSSTRMLYRPFAIGLILGGAAMLLGLPLSKLWVRLRGTSPVDQ